MNDHREMQNYGIPPRPIDVTPVNYPVNVDPKPMDSDIEVIDLDNPRDNIKPTTWHL